MCISLTSIHKKQIVATTGVILILFIIGHLAGNLFIFGGPQAFNGYADKLESLGPLLLVVEYVLAAVFFIHIFLTASLVMENIKARGGINRYAVDVPMKKRSLATHIMPYTGSYILVFLIWHLFDFKFANDVNGLYALVVNSFKDPMHSFLYIIAMGCLGFHLAHGFQSLFQTLGINDPKLTPFLRKASNLFGVFMAVSFSSIPIYVLFFLK